MEANEQRSIVISSVCFESEKEASTTAKTKKAKTSVDGWHRIRASVRIFQQQLADAQTSEGGLDENHEFPLFPCLPFSFISFQSLLLFLLLLLHFHLIPFVSFILSLSCCKKQAVGWNGDCHISLAHTHARTHSLTHEAKQSNGKNYKCKRWRTSRGGT